MSDQPFNDGPFGGDDGSGGGLLDDLREDGEKAVGESLQAAMQRVESFTESFVDADLSDLQNEWKQIQFDLKTALQSGLTAIEEGRTRKRQALAAEEVEALESEIARKNDIIAQLSETVQGLTKERDEKDRRTREELVSLREREAELEEESERLRSRFSEMEEKDGRRREDVGRLNSDLDKTRSEVAQLRATLESEKTFQEERHSALEQQFSQVRLERSTLENEKQDMERRLGELQRRLEGTEQARARAEGDKTERAAEATRLGKENKELAEKLDGVERELEDVRDRGDKELGKLRRQERSLRTELDGARGRVTDALTALRTAAGALESLPAASGEAEPATRDSTPPPEA